MSTPTSERGSKAAKSTARAEAARLRARRRLLVRVGIGVVVVGTIMFGIYGAGGGSGGRGVNRFRVGQPATGAEAPGMQLASTAGGQFDLASQRGKTVLLYFQE